MRHVLIVALSFLVGWLIAGYARSSELADDLKAFMADHNQEFVLLDSNRLSDCLEAEPADWVAGFGVVIPDKAKKWHPALLCQSVNSDYYILKDPKVE